MSKYANSPLWADVRPIPLRDPPINPETGTPTAALAAIAYSDAYSEATSYLRAVMAANEFSERALALTGDIIAMNPAHYTVWLFRARILRELRGNDVHAELAWIDGVAAKHLKNYQLWHHRQLMMSHLPKLPPTEIPFLSHILALDSKNYHVWVYRQWLCTQFPDDLLLASGSSSSPAVGELKETEVLINEDVRNNSAWNHRYFVVFGADELRLGRDEARKVVDEDLIDREIAYAQAKIALAPQNTSPWNYLRGVLKRGGRPITDMREFCEQFARPISRTDDTATDKGVDVEADYVRSSHAIDWLAEIYADSGDVEAARRCLDVLGRKWDPVRQAYWEFRARALPALGSGEDVGGEDEGYEDVDEGDE